MTTRETDWPPPPPAPLSLVVRFGGHVLARATIVSPEGASPETWEFCLEEGLDDLTVARGRKIGGMLAEVTRVLPQREDGKRFDLEGHLERQRRWSERTFGPGDRTAGVVDHMHKELAEVLQARRDYEDNVSGQGQSGADPRDVLPEWIDLVILALDGAWRAGASPREIIAALVAKQDRNEGRKWPDWRTADPNKAIEHDRSCDLRDVVVANLGGPTPTGFANKTPFTVQEVREAAGAFMKDVRR